MRKNFAASARFRSPLLRLRGTSYQLAAARFTAGSSGALDELCATYWRPIYGFIRRRGHTPEQARDLTQGFFALFLERRDVEAVDPSRGRFRSYLLAAVMPRC